MIDTPAFVELEAATLALLHITVPRAEIRSVMGPAFAELAGALRAQGIDPAGPYFCHHPRIDPAVFDFELSVPVTRAVTPVGRVTPGVRAAVRVARTVMHGGYENLAKAWETFDEWIVAEGEIPGASLWEVYLKGPGDSPDPSAWRTELNRSLRAVTW